MKFQEAVKSLEKRVGKPITIKEIRDSGYAFHKNYGVAMEIYKRENHRLVVGNDMFLYATFFTKETKDNDSEPRKWN